MSLEDARRLLAALVVDLHFHFKETSQTRGFLVDPGIDNPGSPLKQFYGQSDTLRFGFQL
jgi:hypothetical protein